MENQGASKSLETVVHDTDYVWVFGKGAITPSASNTANTQYPRYHKNIRCGSAIEARKNEAGTAGLRITRTDRLC